MSRQKAARPRTLCYKFRSTFTSLLVANFPKDKKKKRIGILYVGLVLWTDPPGYRSEEKERKKALKWFICDVRYSAS